MKGGDGVKLVCHHRRLVDSFVGHSGGEEDNRIFDPRSPRSASADLTDTEH